MDRRVALSQFAARFPQAYCILRDTTTRLAQWKRHITSPTNWYKSNRKLIEAPLKPPSDAIIEITERCNLNCVMCPRRFIKVSNSDMSLETYRSVLARLPTVRHVILLGRGETLIHHSINEILHLHRSTHRTTTVVTNGLLLTREIMDALMPGSMVAVSIDSPTEAGYKNIRGGDLKRLQETVSRARGHRHKDILWIVNFMVMRSNMHEMPMMVDFCRQVGANQLSLLMPITFGEELDRAHPFREMEAYRSSLSAAKRRALRHGILLSYTEGPGFAPYKCKEPWTSVRVAVQGDIYPCCFVNGSSEKSYPIWYENRRFEIPQENYRMGNLLELGGIQEVWHGTRYDALRRTIAELEKKPSTPYEERVERFLRNPGGFAYCNICMWRNSIHC